MKNHLVIDSSVYLSYILNLKLYRLAYAVSLYDLKIFINEILLNEITNNIPKKSKYKIDPTFTIIELLKFAKLRETTPSFKDSPDPKDNFLFDLAIQTNSDILVTEEKALLNFTNSPVKIYNIKWFKETYPVP